MKIERMQYNRSIHARKDIERAINQRNSKQSFSAIDPDGDKKEKKEQQFEQEKHSHQEGETSEETPVYYNEQSSASRIDIVV